MGLFFRKKDRSKDDQNQENIENTAPEETFAAATDDADTETDDTDNTEINTEENGDTTDTSDAELDKSGSELSEEEQETSEVPTPYVHTAGAFLNDRWEIIHPVRQGIANFYRATEEDAPRMPRLLAQQLHGKSTFTGTLNTSLWAPLDVFTQDDEDYAVFEDGTLRALGDTPESPNDERYLFVLQGLIDGLLEWQNAQLLPSNDGSWGIGQGGQLHYYGFLQQEEGGDYEELLRTINGRLLRQVFAPSATIRLDDPWSALPLCQEITEFIYDIQEEQISLKLAAAQLAQLAPTKVLFPKVALLSDPGQERMLNEDSGAILHLQRCGELRRNDLDLWAVADGMGGHDSGEIASDLAISTLQQELFKKIPKIDFDDNSAIRKVLFEILERVNQKVYDYGAERNLRSSPGTTLVAALRVGRRIFVLNVGDSRAYLFSQRFGLQRITKDHSYVQELVDRGELDPDDAFGHPQGNIITSNIGMRKLGAYDIFMRWVSPDDKLLIVSDGVVDMIREIGIAKIMQTPDHEILCQNIVDLANGAGGLDNITVLVADFGSEDEE